MDKELVDGDGDGQGNASASNGGILRSAVLDAPVVRCEARFLDGGESELCCCVTTALPRAIDERPEARAYKLGKHRCSYNRLVLSIEDVLTSGRTLKIAEAVQVPIGPGDVDERLRESCLKFRVRFIDGNKINLCVLLVYSSPIEEPPVEEPNYKWITVTRARCRKSENPCTGPALRGLQRFSTRKSQRNLYVAIDEASTHVCPSKGGASTFRFLLVAYDDELQILGSTVSSPIRVLCNNDTPLGAASMKIKCDVKGGWQPQNKSRMAFADVTNRCLGRNKTKRSRSKDENGLEKNAEKHPEEALECSQTPKLGFEPLDQLQSLFSPLQIDYLQKQNPAFLYNFVRYSRELYNMYYRDAAQEITRPTVKRPVLPCSQELESPEKT